MSSKRSVIQTDITKETISMNVQTRIAADEE